jgi:excisionase family DNA binding protein
VSARKPDSDSIPSLVPRLLRIGEAAHYIGATPWFVRSLIWGREIPFVKLGKRLLLDRGDLDRYVDSQKELVQ